MSNKVIIVYLQHVSAGKKGSDLGEYDPLTQADSEDESEEDDLVLNYPRNGLAGSLGAGSSKLRGSRSGRLVGDEDEAQEDEDDEDEWRERLPAKSRGDRDDVTGAQYRSHRDSDRGGEGRAGPSASGGSGVGAHGADAEQKRRRARNAVRSAFFLVPLVCAALLVLLCAFLLPCQKRELEKRPQWESALGEAGGKGGGNHFCCPDRLPSTLPGFSWWFSVLVVFTLMWFLCPGVTPPALSLWDVDGDSVEDVFLGVTEWTNDTRPALGNKGTQGISCWRHFFVNLVCVFIDRPVLSSEQSTARWPCPGSAGRCCGGKSCGSR